MKFNRRIANYSIQPAKDGGSSGVREKGEPQRILLILSSFEVYFQTSHVKSVLTVLYEVGIGYCKYARLSVGHKWPVAP